MSSDTCKNCGHPLPHASGEDACPHCGDKDIRRWSREHDAKTQLEASAPELLAALVHLLQDVDEILERLGGADSAWWDDTVTAGFLHVEQARAAIAKAKGTA